MRVRSLALVLATLATSSLLAAAALDCSLPPPPPPQKALPTRIGRPRGAMIELPAGGTVDRAALVASLRELKFTTVFLQSAASDAGEFANDRVALAVDIQRELDADVFIGTYQTTARKLNGKPMEDLLRKDPTFDKCYAPNGPVLDAELANVDKIRICLQAVAQKVADELTRVNASPRIACYVAHQPQLTDELTDEGRSKLHDLLRDAAAPCAKAKRAVAFSPLLSAPAPDPDRASILLRDALIGTAIGFTILQDGVGTVDPTKPGRASPYYPALRVALEDREDLPMQVWANTEAFDCETPACERTHPTTSERYIKQLCGARALVDAIVTTEYLHDLAGQRLVTGDVDASAELKAIADDVDASAQLRRGYLEWSDAGASCK